MAMKVKEAEKEEKPNCVDYPTEEKDVQNPFTRPKESEIQQLINQEKLAKREKIFRRQTPPFQKKLTKKSQPNPFDIIRNIPDICPSKEVPPTPTALMDKDPEVTQALVKSDKLKNLETTKDFVKTKREIFLIQYLIGVKKDETLRIKNLQTREEKKLDRDEKKLEQDAIQFDLFLKNIDKQTMDAMKQVEIETRLKLDKVGEIRKLNVQIVTLKSKIHKMQEVFHEYKRYYLFLNTVSPAEWKHAKSKERFSPLPKRFRGEKSKTDTASDLKVRLQSTTSIISLRHRRKKPRKGGQDFKDNADQLETDSLGTSSSYGLQTEQSLFRLLREEEEEKIELYFTTPKQLLDVFLGMEEQNLLMIQKCQDTEENLEEIQAEFFYTKKKMTKELNFLKSQTKMLENLVENEKKKSEEFRFLVKLFSIGPFSEEIQDNLLYEINAKVESTYLTVIGPNDAKLNSLQMMTAIENKLEELLQAIDSLPRDVVDAAERQRERHRRMLQRKYKMKMQEELQAERQRRTMDKSVGRRVKMSRRLVSRSVPPVYKRHLEKTQLHKQEDEEYLYFFT